MRLRSKAILCLAAVLASSAGCRRGSPPARVLLVTLDTLRADHVEGAGPAKAETPSLKALAGRGVAFREAYAETPVTFPSHLSLMYGRTAHTLGNYNNGQILPPPPLTSLAEEFRAAGYDTAAFVSLGVLNRRFGLARGFDLYEDEFPDDRWYLDASEVNARALPWLDRAAAGKFFAWIHYSDPHDPYAPPDTPDDLDLVLNGGPIGSYSLAKYTTVDVPLALRRGRNTLVWKIRNLFPARPDAFLARFDRLEILSGTSGVGQPVFGPGWEVRTEDGIHFAKEGAVMTIEAAEPRSVRLVFRGRPVWSVEGVRAMYRREVEFLDRELDRLWAKLDELALWDTTLVVVAGDHGEGLGEFVSAAGEPHIGHIHYLYAYYLRVPLIIVDPESGARGLVRDDPAVLLDVFSTVAERAGFRTGRRQGRSLLGPPAPPDRDLFSATFRPEAAHDKFALRRFPWHLILTPGQGKLEAYDLRSDPEEYRNLGGPDGIPGEARPLQPILEERAREILFKKTEIRIDKKAEDMLRALGYIK